MAAGIFCMRQDEEWVWRLPKEEGIGYNFNAQKKT
jgi:hypothetical protein